MGTREKRQPTMTHDLVISGGSVATMDDGLPRADWEAITHGRISAVGVAEAHSLLVFSQTGQLAGGRGQHGAFPPFG